ncbi:MAG: NADH-dependent phenylglyoxylate dehydrogenase subunit epsilon [Syntrophomonadaceae bacterium]|nr:NADH-dependent phenylglyoxylate dehydrogenase subunit epsilon [Bacillota bacterium]
MRYVIIGNSAAGTSAAETIRHLDPIGSITIISDEKHPAYSRPLTPDFISGELKEEELFYRPGDFHKKNEIELLTGRKVISLNPSLKELTMDNGERVPYDRLLMATGARAIRPSIKGIEYAFTLRTLEDARLIISRISKEIESAVVLGGGLVGLKLAEALHKKGLNVRLVAKSPHLLSRQLDIDGARILQKAILQKGLELTFNQDAVRVEGGNGLTGRVILEDGWEYKAQLVVAGKGVSPRKELIEAAGGSVRAGVVVNEFLETSLPGVYAAGDVAEVTNIVTGQPVVSTLWPSAVVQGRIAGYNMAGEKRSYAGAIIPMNSVDLFGIAMVSLGMTIPPIEGYQVLIHYYPEKGVYRKIVLKEDVVVGAILIGEIEKAGVLNTLIGQKIPVGELKEKLEEKIFSYANFIKPLAPTTEAFTGISV